MVTHKEVMEVSSLETWQKYERLRLVEVLQRGADITIAEQDKNADDINTMRAQLKSLEEHREADRQKASEAARAEAAKLIESNRKHYEAESIKQKIQAEEQKSMIE